MKKILALAYAIPVIASSPKAIKLGDYEYAFTWEVLEKADLRAQLEWTFRGDRWMNRDFEVFEKEISASDKLPTFYDIDLNQSVAHEMMLRKQTVGPLVNFWIIPSQWNKPGANLIGVAITEPSWRQKEIFENDHFVQSYRRLHIIIPKNHTAADQQPLRDLLQRMQHGKQVLPADLRFLKQMIQAPPAKKISPLATLAVIIIIGIVLRPPAQQVANWIWQDVAGLPQPNWQIT